MSTVRADYRARWRETRRQAALETLAWRFGERGSEPACPYGLNTRIGSYWAEGVRLANAFADRMERTI